MPWQSPLNGLPLRLVRCEFGSDCQAVVDGVRRVQAGLYHFQANGSHADLWLRVSKALKRVTSKVTILKVAAHQTIVADLPPLETWAFWQNKLVDAAARKANMQRSDQFWDGWKQLALQLAETRQIYQAVVQVHIRVGKKAASTSNPPDTVAGGLISEGTRRVARRFPNTVQLPLELTVVPTLTHRYRRSNLEAVHAWWLRWGDSSLRRSESVEWVPFLYLALDYMLNEPRIRPLAHRRQWADGVDRPWPFQPAMVELSRSFQCILKAYWKSNGFLSAVRLREVWFLDVTAGCCVLKPRGLRIVWIWFVNLFAAS